MNTNNVKTKEYNMERLNSFLSNVVGKLDEGVEDIGQENKDLLGVWMKGMNEEMKEGKTIVVQVNEEMMRRDDLVQVEDLNDK